MSVVVSRRGWWTRERLALAALGITLSVVVLANHPGVLTPDTKPEIFLAPWRTARDFARPWLDSPEMGAANYNVGVAPVAAVIGLITSIGVPAWLAQRVWRIALLLVAALAARALYRELSAGSAADTAAGRVAVAIAYAANPYAIVGGGTTPTLLPYALYPLVLLHLLRATRGSAWRHGAAAGLLLAATSGLNAGVATLVLAVGLVPLAAHLRLVERRRLRALAGALWRTGLLYAALSLYWAVPTLFARSRATTGLGNTETLESINVGASFAEAVRGLGMWTLYGSGPDGPFLPGQTAYLTSWWVVLATFALPVLAAIGACLPAGSARIFGAGSVLTGALVMSAPFPYADRSPWGDLAVAVLDGIPGAAAFRTLNKAGPVLELGLAVLAGLAVAALVRRLRAPWTRGVALAAAAAVVGGLSAPAWTGGLFPVTLDVPDYWQDAARHINAPGRREAPGRVLLAPGEKLADYTWGYGGPDEIGSSLFERPNVFRTATPSSNPETADLLEEADRRLYLGVLPAGTMSALARIASIEQVVGRYDARLPAFGTERTEAALAADAGLGPAAAYGPYVPGGIQSVTVRPVTGAGQRMVLPARGALLVDGGGGVLPDLVAAGLMGHAPTLLLAGALDDGQLRAALGDGARVVLSDSNGRREWSDDPTRTGALLPASARTDRTRALYTSADQTVAISEGNASVTTRGPGQVFGPFAAGDPLLAFDGDPSTAWQFGNFGTGAGNALTVRFAAPRTLDAITIRAMNSVGVHISRLRVFAEGPRGVVERTATVSEWATFPVAVGLGSKRFTSVTIEATAISGDGDGWVGLAEIGIPGVQLRKVARTPTGLPTRLTSLDPAVLAATPVDVVLHRRRGDAAGLDAEEPRLERDLLLPDSRSYALRGSVRLTAGTPDSQIDDLLGADLTVVADSSSRAFGNPALRASAALDDDPASAWIPADPVDGEWISVSFPSRRIDGFTLTQNADGAVITRALVSVDDGTPFEVTLRPGTNRIELPERVRARQLRVLITGHTGAGFVRVLDLGLPAVELPGRPPNDCLTLAELDGQPLRVRLEASRAGLARGDAVAFTACEGASIDLAGGVHRIRSRGAFAIDDLHLAGAAVSAAAARPGGPAAITVTRRGPTRVAATLSADCAPCYLSSGQGWNPAWTARIGERSLGSPIVVDGYAAGWRFEGRRGDEVVAEYGPRRPAMVAWLISTLAALVCAGMLARPMLRRRRSPTPQPGRSTRPSLAGSRSTRPLLAGSRLARPPRAWPPRAWPVSRGSAGAHRAPVTGPRAAATSRTGLPVPRGPAARRAVVLAVAVLGAGVTVGVIPALVLAGLLGAWVRGWVRAEHIGRSGVAATALIPLAWYAGPRHGEDPLLTHVAANTLAHQVAGLAVWLLVVGTLLPLALRSRAGPSPPIALER